jgi:hypothetical protein
LRKYELDCGIRICNKYYRIVKYLICAQDTCGSVGGRGETDVADNQQGEDQKVESITPKKNACHDVKIRALGSAHLTVCERTVRTGKLT